MIVQATIKSHKHIYWLKLVKLTVWKLRLSRVTWRIAVAERCRRVTAANQHEHQKIQNDWLTWIVSFNPSISVSAAGKTSIKPQKRHSMTMKMMIRKIPLEKRFDKYIYNILFIVFTQPVLQNLVSSFLCRLHLRNMYLMCVQNWITVKTEPNQP